MGKDAGTVVGSAEVDAFCKKYSNTAAQTNSLKTITSAADCTAAGGKGFNYCPQTGKYYCCDVTNSDYTVCSGTDGACPSNSGLKNCVCPPKLTTNDRCGSGGANQKCYPGTFCSQWSWCGKGALYESGSQTAYNGDPV
jgi:hypothetical protein